MPTYDQPIASPLVASDPGLQSTAQFKPAHSFPHIPQPKQLEFSAPPSFLIPATELNEIQSLDSSPSEFLTSVMNNVPASEVPSPTNPATLNSSTISHIVRSPMGASETPQPESSPKPVRKFINFDKHICTYFLFDRLFNHLGRLSCFI